MDFKEKVTLITGAAAGIGKEMALQLASQGACLSLADVNAAALDETVGECRESHDRSNLREDHPSCRSRQRSRMHHEHEGKDRPMAEAHRAENHRPHHEKGGRNRTLKSVKPKKVRTQQGGKSCSIRKNCWAVCCVPA